MSEVEQLKEQGNNLLKSGDYDGAIDRYSQAIDLAPTNHILYSNRSAAYMKTGSYTTALADAMKCTDLAPTWAKGYSRVAAAYEMMGEIAKSNEAREKAKSLGWSTPTTSFSSSSSAPSSAPVSSAASFSSLDPKSKALVGLRAFFLLNSLLYVLGVGGPGAFSRALFAAFGCYALELYTLHGKPSMSIEYAQKVVPDWRSHFAMTALLFAFAGEPRFIVLLLHLLAELGHIAETVMKFAPAVAGKLEPVANSMILPRFVGVPDTEWSRLPLREKWFKFNQRVSQFNSGLEVAIGITLAVELLTTFRNFFLVFGYWQFLRIRYMVSQEVKDVFAALDTKISSLIASYPAVVSAYAKFRSFAAGMVRMPTPEEAQRQREQGLMGTMRNSCVIS